MRACVCAFRLLVSWDDRWQTEHSISSIPSFSPLPSADDYFVSRKLYPNIDFYSGLIYKAIGFPLSFFPVLFTMGRMVGWLAHVRPFLAASGFQSLGVHIHRT